MSFYDLLMDLWDVLISLGWKLPILLVFGAGLWHLRHAPPHPLRRRAAWAMWIVLVGVMLQWGLQQLALPLAQWLVSGELTIVQSFGYVIAARISWTASFGCVLVQTLGYALLLQVLIRALRSRER